MDAPPAPGPGPQDDVSQRETDQIARYLAVGHSWARARHLAAMVEADADRPGPLTLVTGI